MESFIPEFASALAPIDWNASLTGYYLLNDLTLEVFKTAEEWYRGSEADGQRLVDFQQSIESIRNWGEACHYLTRLVEQFWHWRSHSSDRYAHLLLRVKEYITSNYDKDHISLQDAAESINMSPSHLSKIFSQETGQTFIEFLTQTRINKAMELLQSTQAKTYEIAFQVGYSDPHYFSNLFKRVTGMTTTEFRKQGASSTAAVSFGLAEGEQDERASFLRNFKLFGLALGLIVALTIVLAGCQGQSASEGKQTTMNTSGSSGGGSGTGGGITSETELRLSSKGLPGSVAAPAANSARLSESPSEASMDQTPLYTFGIIYPMAHPFYEEITRLTEEAASPERVRLVVKAPEVVNLEQQIHMMETMIQQKWTLSPSRLSIHQRWAL